MRPKMTCVSVWMRRVSMRSDRMELGGFNFDEFQFDCYHDAWWYRVCRVCYRQVNEEPCATTHFNSPPSSGEPIQKNKQQQYPTQSHSAAKHPHPGKTIPTCPRQHGRHGQSWGCWSGSNNEIGIMWVGNAAHTNQSCSANQIHMHHTYTLPSSHETCNFYLFGFMRGRPKLMYVSNGGSDSTEAGHSPGGG